ncbi:hypothetical protein ISCGN_006689 [Ixodes scapularis]
MDVRGPPPVEAELFKDPFTATGIKTNGGSPTGVGVWATASVWVNVYKEDRIDGVQRPIRVDRYDIKTTTAPPPSRILFFSLFAAFVACLVAASAALLPDTNTTFIRSTQIRLAVRRSNLPQRS